MSDCFEWEVLSENGGKLHDAPGETAASMGDRIVDADLPRGKGLLSFLSLRRSPVLAVHDVLPAAGQPLVGGRRREEENNGLRCVICSRTSLLTDPFADRTRSVSVGEFSSEDEHALGKAGMRRPLAMTEEETEEEPQNAEATEAGVSIVRSDTEYASTSWTSDTLLMTDASSRRTTVVSEEEGEEEEDTFDADPIEIGTFSRALVAAVATSPAEELQIDLRFQNVFDVDPPESPSIVSPVIVAAPDTTSEDEDEPAAARVVPDLPPARKRRRARRRKTGRMRVDGGFHFHDYYAPTVSQETEEEGSVGSASEAGMHECVEPTPMGVLTALPDILPELIARHTNASLIASHCMAFALGVVVARALAMRVSDDADLHM